MLDENQLIFSVVHKQGINATGKRINYYINYSGTPQTFTLHPNNYMDLILNNLQPKTFTCFKPRDFMVTTQQ